MVSDSTPPRMSYPSGNVVLDPTLDAPFICRLEHNIWDPGLDALVHHHRIAVKIAGLGEKDRR